MADVKRLNYFTSQFLVEKDFKDEQGYHVNMRRRHNQLLHTWGVADGGLLVTKSGDKFVGISSGLAIDKDGKEIVLLDAQSIDLAKFESNAYVYITVKYQEISDDHYTDTAGVVNNYTRTTERPLVEAGTTVPVNDGSVIVLAKVKLDGSGNIGAVDGTVRKLAGSAIDPTANLVAGSLSVMGNTTVSGNVGIGTTNPGRTLEVSGSGSSGGRIRSTNTDSDVVIELNDGTNTKAFLKYNRKNDDLSLYHTLGGNQLVLKNSGNVGIGTAAPDHKFAVSDGSNATQAIFGQDRTSGNSRIVIGEQDAAGKSVNIDYNHASKYGSIQIGGDALGSALVIAAGGRVGIGTTDIKRQLHVEGLEIHSGGRLAGFSFSDRGSEWSEKGENGTRWSWYSVGGTARLWGGDDRLSIDGAGNVGIGTTTPGARLEIKGGDLLIKAAKAAAEDPGDIIFQTAAGAQKGRIWSEPAAGAGLHFSSGDNTPDVTIDKEGNLWAQGCIFAGNSALYFTRTDYNHTKLGDELGHAAIENAADLGALMILGRATKTSPGAPIPFFRVVKLWDMIEVNGVLKVNGTQVVGSSIEMKQDVRALSERDYREIHDKLVKTPLYHYRFKAKGIDQKFRMGVISEESPSEILDETGKYVSVLDYIGFLFAAVKAQATEIKKLEGMISTNAKSDLGVANSIA